MIIITLVSPVICTPFCRMENATVPTCLIHGWQLEAGRNHGLYMSLPWRTQATQYVRVEVYSVESAVQTFSRQRAYFAVRPIKLKPRWFQSPFTTIPALSPKVAGEQVTKCTYDNAAAGVCAAHQPASRETAQVEPWLRGSVSSLRKWLVAGFGRRAEFQFRTVLSLLLLV